MVLTSTPESENPMKEDIVPLEMRSHATIIDQAEQLDPVVALFEAAKNAWEGWLEGGYGTAPHIAIFPSTDGTVVLRDNGPGIGRGEIAELLMFGEGKKKKGAGEGQNMGWGASLTYPVLNPVNGATITSWTKADLDWAYQLKMIVGAKEGKRVVAFRSLDGQVVARVKKPIATPSGTEVRFGDTPFNADLIQYEFEQRFLRFRTRNDVLDARVMLYDRDPGTQDRPGTVLTPLFDRVRALKASDLRVGKKRDPIPSEGTIETPHAIVYWIILEKPAKGVAGCSEFFANEVMEHTTQGISKKHDSFGVWAAPGHIVLLVQRRNAKDDPKVIVDLTRQATMHWKDRLAGAEVSAIINAPCPPEPEWHPLRLFMQDFADRNEEADGDEAAQKKMLRRWGTPSPKLESPVGKRVDEPGNVNSVPVKEEQPKGPNGKGGGNGGGVPRVKKKKRTFEATDNGTDTLVGMPKCHLSTSMTELVDYIPARNLLLLNRDRGITKALLKEAQKQRKTKGTVRRLKCHLVHSFVTYHAETGKIPSGDVLAALAMSPTAAIDYVRTEGAYKKHTATEGTKKAKT